MQQKYDQLRKADPNAKKLTTTQKLQKYLEATQLIMNPIVESVRPLHSAKVWEDISPQFLVTFWSLSMYDLHVPNEIYQREIGKLKQLAQQAADGKDSVSYCADLYRVVFLHIHPLSESIEKQKGAGTLYCVNGEAERRAKETA